MSVERLLLKLKHYPRAFLPTSIMCISWEASGHQASLWSGQPRYKLYVLCRSRGMDWVAALCKSAGSWCQPVLILSSQHGTSTRAGQDWWCVRVPLHSMDEEVKNTSGVTTQPTNQDGLSMGSYLMRVFLVANLSRMHLPLEVATYEAWLCGGIKLMMGSVSYIAGEWLKW